MNRLLDTRLQTILLTGSLFLIYIFSMLTLSDYIDVIGSKVFSSDPLMDFQLSLILYWLFGLIFIFFPINHKTKSVIVYAYIFRFIFLHTITIGYLFLYSSDKGFSVISLDEMIYFIRGFTLGSEEFGYVGSGLITRINYIFTQFLPINFFLYRALFGLLSFAGIILIWRAISEYYEDKFYPLLLLLLFFPSVTFWSLNMGKEPVILIGLGIYLLGHFRLLKNLTLQSLLITMAGLMIIGIVRPWVVLILAPGLAISFLGTPKITKSTKLFLISSAFVLLPFILSTIVSLVIRGDTSDIQNQETYLQTLFSIVNKFISEGTTTDVVNNPLVMASEVRQISSITDLINPWRIFSAIFRPFPGEAGGAIGIVVGLESMFLLIISIITLVKFFLKKVRMDMVSWILLSHILFWGILYGAILDFNWGYLFRQKVIVLPFVLSFIFIIHNKSSKMIN